MILEINVSGSPDHSCNPFLIQSPWPFQSIVGKGLAEVFSHTCHSTTGLHVLVLFWITQGSGFSSLSIPLWQHIMLLKAHVTDTILLVAHTRSRLSTPLWSLRKINVRELACHSVWRSLHNHFFRSYTRCCIIKVHLHACGLSIPASYNAAPTNPVRDPIYPLPHNADDVILRPKTRFLIV